VTHGILPDTARPSRRRSQWLGLTAVTVAIAVAAIVVPPLITPHHRAQPPAVASAAPSTSLAQPVAATSSPARFAPITVEAEDPHNTVSGGAAATECATCHGGGRVRYICLACRVVVRTTMPVSGRRTVTVIYEADGPRSLKVGVNDARAAGWPVTGPGWTTQRSFHFTADLPAGPLRLTLFNDESPAPDVDAVIIS